MTATAHAEREAGAVGPDCEEERGADVRGLELPQKLRNALKVALEGVHVNLQAEDHWVGDRHYLRSAIFIATGSSESSPSS